MGWVKLWKRVGVNVGKKIGALKKRLGRGKLGQKVGDLEKGWGSRERIVGKNWLIFLLILKCPKIPNKME